MDACTPPPTHPVAYRQESEFRRLFTVAEDQNIFKLITFAYLYKVGVADVSTRS
jgi:hypothetical protein